MTPAARSLVPMAFVKSVPASIAFYRLLGFEVGNTFAAQGSEEPTWAYLQAGKAQLMLALASHPVVAAQQAVCFYVYCDDVAAMRDELIAKGVSAGPITTPFYAPRGEFRIQDPDGYGIFVMHT
jgi:catechol 2,3-dioxygenase-like lactoylglutathione lyase family enzyme